MTAPIDVRTRSINESLTPLRLAYSRNATDRTIHADMSQACSGNFDVLGVREVNDHIHFLRERASIGVEQMAESRSILLCLAAARGGERAKT